MRYVGASQNIEKRWGDHVRDLNNRRHHSRSLNDYWRLFGAKAFSFSIVIICEKCDLRFYEQAVMDFYAPEFNTSPTAGSQLGYRHSEKTRQKLSVAAKRTRNFTGKKHTDESKQKISKAKTGVTQDRGVVERRTMTIRKRRAWPAKRRFSEDQIRAIRARSAAGESNKSLASKFKVSDSVICEIKKRRAYRWVE